MTDASCSSRSPSRSRSGWRRPCRPSPRPRPTGSSASPRTRRSSIRGVCTAVQEESPIPDYAFPGVENERLATGLAGFVGTLGVFALGCGLAYLLRRRDDAIGALCNHSLELTGLAGDPASPVHRLDPRAKVVGILGDHARRRVTTPLTAWPVFAALRAGARGDRRRGSRARARDLAPRALRAAARAVRRGLRAVPAAGRHRLRARAADRALGRARGARARVARRRRSARSAPCCWPPPRRSPLSSARSRRCVCRACSCSSRRSCTATCS